MLFWTTAQLSNLPTTVKDLKCLCRPFVQNPSNYLSSSWQFKIFKPYLSMKIQKLLYCLIIFLSCWSACYWYSQKKFPFFETPLAHLTVNWLWNAPFWSVFLTVSRSLMSTKHVWPFFFGRQNTFPLQTDDDSLTKYGFTVF